EGVECPSIKYNGTFVLHGCVLSWSGDTPALTKLMGLTGHNSYKGCRYCNIKGIYFSHIYYPTKPPRDQEENGQDFYFPSANYKLSQSELKKIKQHFSTISDVSGLQLMSFSHEGTKYGRLRTKDVDIYANYPKQLSVFEVQDFYAIVEYYLTYEFEGSKAMLAYIQWMSSVEKDNVGLKSFRRLDAYAFIDASAIDYCVGFIEIANLFYIVDKEVDNEQ
ncbi:8692_t:CDS:2, partial [Racocetra persica]